MVILVLLFSIFQASPYEINLFKYIREYGIMGELKVKLPDTLERRFREYAHKKYGYKKGALSMAAESAIREITKKETDEKNDAEERFLKTAGAWKDIDGDALIKKIYESRKLMTRKRVEF